MAKTPEQLRRMKETHYLRESGRPVLVPVAPVQRHLRSLHYTYGMTVRSIAARCSLSDCSVSEIIAGGRTNPGEPLRLIRRENAESALRVRPEIPTDGGRRVNAVGSTRRVQGLAALGYPVKWQGQRIGSPGRTFYLLAQGHRKVTFFSTAHKIRVLYEKLEMDVNPEGHGITRQAARMAQSSARRKGFVLPILWDFDTLDDPDGYPDFTGHCGTSTGAQYHRRHEIYPVCQPCLDAYNDYNEGRKERLRRGVPK